MEDIRRQTNDVRRTIITGFDMKRHLTTSVIARTFAVLALALCTYKSASAQEYQNTPVQISTEKVRIGNEVCYSHVVQEKQTLYSICKAYNVSTEDIYKYNPSVKENGLKKHSIIIIPIIEKKGLMIIKPEKEEPVLSEAPAKESVKEPVKAIEPVKEPLKEEAPKKRPSKRKVHTAKWYEDLETIAEKYGVTVGEIMRANNLTSKKLSKRQKLVIPAPGEYPTEDVISAEDEQTAASDTTATVSADTLAKDKAVFLPGLYFPKKQIDMTLLLPLKATGLTGSRQNMDFYSGVLLAVYDMSKEGISTNLTVYDVADGKIPEAGSMKGSDIILGPVSSSDINRTFSSVPNIKTLVSPLDPKAEYLAYMHESMVHAPTPHSVQYNDLISWIKEDLMPEDRVLFITEKGAVPTEAVTNMTMAIDSSGIDYKPLSYSILEGRNVTETLAWMMSETAANRVFIASESEAFVNDVVRNLNVMIHQKYNVVLYAPSKIRSFETIEVENFHNTKMRVSTGYYIDYENPTVQEFLLRYRALFNTEPTQFAYQGYDLAKYFIRICSKYGNRWMDKLENEKASMLQSKFDFTKTQTGGYVNNGVSRIVYGDNWTVEKVR